MRIEECDKLKPGKAYRVVIRGQKRMMRRIFKWGETRFGGIRCYVFTSPANKSVTATGDGKTLSMTGGRRLPASEVSVPHYDLQAFYAEH